MISPVKEVEESQEDAAEYWGMSSCYTIFTT
jgi:hypothetical protein